MSITQQIRQAYTQNQSFVVVEGMTFILPKLQKAGTLTQQETYLRKQVLNVAEVINSKIKK